MSETVDPEAQFWVEPDPVVLDRVPQVYALYQRDPLPETANAEDGVHGWVLELPGGQAVVFDVRGGHHSFGVWSSLRSAATRYGSALDCDLVTLTDHAPVTG